MITPNQTQAYNTSLLNGLNSGVTVLPATPSIGNTVLIFLMAGNSEDITAVTGMCLKWTRIGSQMLTNYRGMQIWAGTVTSQVNNINITVGSGTGILAFGLELPPMAVVSSTADSPGGNAPTQTIYPTASNQFVVSYLRTGGTAINGYPSAPWSHVPFTYGDIAWTTTTSNASLTPAWTMTGSNSWGIVSLVLEPKALNLVTSGKLSFPLGTNGSELDYPNPTLNAKLEASNVSWFRVDACWNYAKGIWPGIEMTPGDYNASCAASIASLKAQLEAINMELLVVVDGGGEGSPQPGPLLASEWSSGPACTPEQFGNMMGWLAGQVPGVHWELFNEPDYEGQSAALYGQAVELAYSAMKAADPTCTVHAGILSSSDALSFLETAYSSGMLGNFDVFDFHTYPYPTASDPDSKSLANYITQLQGVRASYGDYQPTWLTETGWQSMFDGVMTPALQAQYFQEWMTELDQLTCSYFTNVFWYNIEDYSGGYWGFFDTSGNPKPLIIQASNDLQAFRALGSGRLRLI